MTDGGSPLDEVYSVCPDAADAGPPRVLEDGSWVLPYPRGPRQACLLAGCDDYARRSEQPVPALSSTGLALVLVFSVLSLVLGFIGGWWLDRQVR